MSLIANSTRLVPIEIDHLRSYLPPHLVERLQLQPSSPAPDILAHLTKLLETIQSHLPPYLVEQVLRDPTPGQVGGRFISGTLLLADMSGFVELSERLGRANPTASADEITAII